MKKKTPFKIVFYEHISNFLFSLTRIFFYKLITPYSYFVCRCRVITRGNVFVPSLLLVLLPLLHHYNSLSTAIQWSYLFSLFFHSVFFLLYMFKGIHIRMLKVLYFIFFFFTLLHLVD